MNETKRLHDDLMAYGEIKADIETVEEDGCRRMRVIELDGKKYFHHMFNGEIVEIFEV